MSEQNNPYFEYLEANQGLIAEITTLIDQHLDDSPERTVVVMSPDQEQPQIIAGESTPEGVIESAAKIDAIVTYEDAVEIAQAQNRALQGEVAINVIGLRSTVTKFDVTRRYQEDLEDLKAEVPSLLAYAQATYEAQSFKTPDGSIILKKLTMVDIGSYQSAVQYTIDQEHGGLMRTSAFLVLDDRPIFSHQDMNMTFDPLFQRAYSLLPEARTEVALLLSGSHRDQAEIEDTLELMWQKYVGTSKEVEIVPLIDELYTRGMAILSELDMVKLFDTSRLSVDQLTELRDALS